MTWPVRSVKKGRKNTGVSFYWQHYGLLQDPFSLVFQEGLFYVPQKWENHFELLTHLIKSKNVLLAVIGREGSGKTTFASYFQQQLGESMQLYTFSADSLFSTRKLVREMEKGFQLKVPNGTSPEEQLDAQISAIQYRDRTCLLVIDNAHYLPLETLNSLLFLLKQQSDNQMRLHILLLGDKNLQIKLTNLVKQECTNNMVHSIELEPLDLEETCQYVEQRLKKSGWKGELPFNQIRIEQIYGASGGFPERINRHAQQLLLDQLERRKLKQNPSLMSKHKSKLMGTFLVLFALVTVAYFLDQRHDNHFDILKINTPIAKVEKLTEVKKPIALPHDQVEKIPSLAFPSVVYSPTTESFPVISKLPKFPKFAALRKNHLYTIELIGLSHRSSINHFIKRYGLEGKTHVVKTKVHGKDLFLLLYGTYESNLAASEAIQRLPKHLKKYKPFPRKNVLANQ